MLNFSKSISAAKIALSILRKIGGVYIHERLNKKRVYRLCDPEVLTYIFSEKIFNLWKLKQERYCRLIGLILIEILKNFNNLQSVVVYGSVARGVARVDSDVDLLIIMESNESLSKRIDKFLKIEFSNKISEELDWLYKKAIDTHISFLPLNPKEAEAFPPILLDVINEGIVLFDDGFYKELTKKKKEVLSKLKAKRVFLSKNEWFWDLKPEIKFGEVIEI
ncbi:MAG: nucleotidyltransferase domain-containing protein [Candidatus Bathyarchaeia archaeon]